MLALSHKHNKKTHIYRLNNSHRTAINRWQKNLNFNNGKNLVTYLGKTREKRRVREGESEPKGIPLPGKSPDGRKDEPNRRDLQMQRRAQQ